MATFLSISGPSVTGKTTIVNYLKSLPETKHILFSPDVHDVIWEQLKSGGYFDEFTEIVTDYEYLCTFIMRVVDYYNGYIDSMKDSDAIVILDRCWVDFAIYSLLNLWYTSAIRPVQEEIFHKISIYDESIKRIYITKIDDESYPVGFDRARGGMTTFRMNRALETQYYEIAKHLKNSVALPSSDLTDCASFIIEDMRNLGYLQ